MFVSRTCHGKPLHDEQDISPLRSPYKQSLRGRLVANHTSLAPSRYKIIGYQLFRTNSQGTMSPESIDITTENLFESTLRR
jgi:hypothetical protein